MQTVHADRGLFAVHKKRALGHSLAKLFYLKNQGKQNDKIYTYCNSKHIYVDCGSYLVRTRVHYGDDMVSYLRVFGRSWWIS